MTALPLWNTNPLHFKTPKMRRLKLKQKSFKEHFEFAFESFGIGLKAPTSLFMSVTQGVATITTLATLIDHYGTKVSIREILMTVPAGYASAAFVAELGKVAGGCIAAGYAGICIGAIAYATGQWTSERLWTFEEPKLSPKDFLPLCRKKGIKISPKLQNYFEHDFQNYVNMKRCLQAR